MAKNTPDPTTAKLKTTSFTGRLNSIGEGGRADEKIRLTIADVLVAYDVAQLLGFKSKQLPFDQAEPNSATGCVLAAAFDHECSIEYWEPVRGYRHNRRFKLGGRAVFGDGKAQRAAAKSLASEFGVKPVGSYDGADIDVPPNDEDDGDGNEWYVPIPDGVIKIAIAYDDPEGQRALQRLAEGIGWTYENAGS